LKTKVIARTQRGDKLLRIIKDYYEVKSKLVNTLKVTYLAKGSVGYLYRYRSEEILRILKTFFPKKENPVVLDLGCGAGWYLRELEKGSFAIGVDFCKEYLLAAKLWCKSADLVLADACNLPFRDFSVDFVLCSELIEHLLNPDETLKEIARVLHKGGLVLVTTPMKYSINEILGRKNSRHNIEHPNVLTYSQFFV
jgi:ubiquinone/menaquinone biosynthesis C-methylase UbiE